MNAAILWRLALLAVVLSALGPTTVVWAHSGHSPPPRGVSAAVEEAAPSAPEPLPTAVALAPVASTKASSTRVVIGWVALLGLAVVAARRLRRRAVSGALAALLAIFAVEGSVHSVHHLDSDAEMAKCRVAAAASHLSGTIEEPVALTPAWTPREVVLPGAPPVGGRPVGREHMRVGVL